MDLNDSYNRDDPKRPIFDESYSMISCSVTFTAVSNRHVDSHLISQTIVNFVGFRAKAMIDGNENVFDHSTVKNVFHGHAILSYDFMYLSALCTVI